MTTYYVRTTGNDASAGTAAGTAWRTVGKAVATVVAGDTVFIGGGIYREAITLTQSFASDVFLTGDVDGSQTGDAGEVRLSASTSGPTVATPAQTVLKVVGKNHYYWKNIVFVSSSATNVIDATTTTAGGTNWTFDDCAILNFSFTAALAAVLFTAVVDTTHTWAFNRCLIWTSGPASAVGINIPTTATAADFDIDFSMKNCLVVSNGSVAAVKVTGTGANSNKGGGVDLQSCTLMGAIGFNTAGAGLLSTSIPCTIYNSLAIGNTTGLSAATSGQIIEDFNFISAVTARTNVTAGTHSSVTGIETTFSLGQERIWDGPLRQPFSPSTDSALLGWGANVASPARLTVDALNAPRPAGTTRILASGTATAGAATTITDSGASFGTLVGATVRLTGGTGSGQTKVVKSNTGTVITVYGNWNTTPDSTSTYSIYTGAVSETGKATSSTSTVITMSSSSWVTNMFAGYTIEITAGTAVGQTNTVTSNTGTTITSPTWGVTPDNTSTFSIYRQTGINAVLDAVGAFERSNTALKEVTLTDAGSVAIKIEGWGYQDIRIPVDNTATTITVKCSFDTAHGNTTKPTAAILVDAEIGVTAETKTCTGSAGSGTFETLTFTAQTPSAKGFVVVRLQGRSDAPYGRAIFDTFSVT